MKIKTTRDFLERALALYRKHPQCNDTYVAFSIIFHEMLEEKIYVHAQIGVITHNARLRIRDAFMHNNHGVPLHEVHDTMGLMSMVALIEDAIALKSEYCNDKTIHFTKK